MSTPYTHTEEYRLLCEAREVLAWPLVERRRYLGEVCRHRGADACEKLKDAMTREFELRKAKK